MTQLGNTNPLEETTLHKTCQDTRSVTMYLFHYRTCTKYDGKGVFSVFLLTRGVGGVPFGPVFGPAREGGSIP